VHPGGDHPDVTQASIGSTICRAGYTGTIRPPAAYTSALKRQQIVAYGYPDTNPADYEEDHLNVRHSRVCAGTLALVEAQPKPGG
jgi:hypothetical protein